MASKQDRTTLPPRASIWLQRHLSSEVQRRKNEKRPYRIKPKIASALDVATAAARDDDANDNAGDERTLFDLTLLSIAELRTALDEVHREHPSTVHVRNYLGLCSFCQSKSNNPPAANFKSILIKHLRSMFCRPLTSDPFAVRPKERLVGDDDPIWAALGCPPCAVPPSSSAAAAAGGGGGGSAKPAAKASPARRPSPSNANDPSPPSKRTRTVVVESGTSDGARSIPSKEAGGKRTP